MKNFSVALMTALIIFTGAANAEDNLTITLEEAIALALENNRLIEQAQEDRESARLELSAARKSFGPTLSWNSSSMSIGGRNYHSAREDRYRFRAMDEETRREHNINLADYPPYKSSNSNSVTLSIPLYTGGQLEGQIKSADFGLTSADLILENTRQAVKFQTAQAYYQVLQCKNLMKVRQEELNNLNEHLRVVQIQYDVGNVAMSDVIETKVQIADSRQGLNTVRGDYENAVATLNNIIGLPTDTPLAVSDNLEYLPHGQSEVECLEYALEHRPDGIAAIYEIKRAEAQINAAKSGFRPSVSAIVQGSMTGEGAFKADQTKESWAAGIHLEWDIFDNNVTSTRVEQAKSAHRKAESLARENLETIRLEIHNAYTNLKIAEENIKITAEAIEEAKEKFLIAQVRYEEGEDTNLPVMDAQEKLTQAQVNYFDALYSYNMNKAQLEKAMGIPIEIDAAIYSSAVENGKTATKALEKSAVAPSTVLDERGKVKKRSEDDIQPVRKSETEILRDEPFIKEEN